MCIAVLHFTEIICNITTVNISVFDNRTVPMFLLRGVSQPVISLGCEGKRNHVYSYKDLS